MSILSGYTVRADAEIWESARRESYVIVSKDNDFRQLSFLYGPPPKVVWVSVGNGGTDAIANLLERHRGDIEAFGATPDEGLLVLDLKE